MIYKSSQVTITYDTSVPCIVWTPQGFVKGDAFRDPFIKGIDFMEEEIKKVPQLTWLNDTRKLKTAAVEDVQWLNKNVNDKVIALGLRKVAFVLPENVFGRWSIKLYIDFTEKRSDLNMLVKAFIDIEDARDWLKSQVSTSAKETTLL